RRFSNSACWAGSWRGRLACRKANRKQPQEQIGLVVEPSDRVAGIWRWRRDRHCLRPELCRCRGARQVPRLQCYNVPSSATAESVMGVDLLNIEGLKQLE